MNKLVKALLVVVGVIVPTWASAQSLSGVVTDSSGAVLPGVTVEATSPVLIEKVRTAVTDGTGQYRIADLLPGTYTVTFTLAGFTTLRREAVEVAGASAQLANGRRGTTLTMN